MEELTQPPKEGFSLKALLSPAFLPLVIASLVIVSAYFFVRERSEEKPMASNGQNQKTAAENIPRPSSPPTPEPCPGEQSFTRVEDATASSSATCRLDLSNKQLTTFDDAIGSMENLQELDLRGNQFDDVPLEIFGLTKLTRLNLAFNRFSTIPPEIGNLRNVVELQLYNNLLTSIPPDIGRLTNLRILYLHNNQLTTLPEEMKNLGFLENLYLHGNKFSAEEQVRIKKLLPHTNVVFQGPSEE